MPSKMVWTKSICGALLISSISISRLSPTVYLVEGDIESAEKLIQQALNAFYQYKHPEAYLCLEDLAEVNKKKSILALKL